MVDQDRLVCSDGGPHVLVSGSDAHLWRPSPIGFWGLTLSSLVLGKLGVPMQTVMRLPLWGLYGRACAVAGDAGTIRFGRSRAVVLAQSPAFSCWERSPDGAGVDIFALEQWRNDDLGGLVRRAAEWATRAETGHDGAVLVALKDALVIEGDGGAVLLPASDEVAEPVYGFERVPMEPGCWRGAFCRYVADGEDALIVRLRIEGGSQRGVS